MMYVGSEDSTHEFPAWPPDWQEAYMHEAPPFDPKRTGAYREWSILTEYLRTWPGAERSNHPDSSFAAVGERALWLMADHPLHYPLGLGSPLDKLVGAEGQVLLLGAPFESLTIIHHAEELARIENKRRYHYRAPMLIDSAKRWVDIEDYDTQAHIFDWQGESYFEIIPRQYLASGRGRSGKVGAAQSYIFDAAGFDRFAIEWLESHIGEHP
jgi:aminoglycoside 3-N-acetyltransferase